MDSLFKQGKGLKRISGFTSYQNAFQMINVQKGFMQNTQIENNLRERLSNYCKLTRLRNNLQKELLRLRYSLETFRARISDFLCNDHQIRLGLQKFSVTIYLF